MSSKSSIQIRKLDSLTEEIEKVDNRIRERGYENYLRRGGAPGRELEDWLEAERDLIVSPLLTLVEMEDHFIMLLSVGGMDTRDLDVLVSDESVLVQNMNRPLFEVHGRIHTHEFEPRQTFRHIPLPRQIQPESVRAEYQSGILRLTANFAESDRASSPLRLSYGSTVIDRRYSASSICSGGL